MYGDYITICIICGIVCFLFAKERGKNPFVWFAIGLVSSLIGVMIIALIKKKKNKKIEDNENHK